MSQPKFCMLWLSLHMLQQNLVSEEAKIFLKVFWDFQWWKFTFYRKFSKNGLVSEKNYFIFFHNRGGGAGTLMEFSIIFFIFFFWNFPLFGLDTLPLEVENYYYFISETRPFFENFQKKVYFLFSPLKIPKNVKTT